MRPTSRGLVFIVCAFVFMAMAARFLDHTTDDAFISFRYAENLVHGHGLVYNPGERVEGYTNFAWVLCLAPFLALSWDPERVAQVLGLGAAIATLLAVVRLSPRPARAPWIVWVAPLFLATSPPFVVWATGGLETPLFTCLVAWSAALMAEGLERGRIPAGSAVLAGLAALTRPEGAGVAVVLVLLAATVARREPGLRRQLARWGGLFLLVFLPYFLWRWHYYGHLLPNTFYVKVSTQWSQVLRGIDYVRDFLTAVGPWIVLPCIGLRWFKRSPTVLLHGGLTIALAIYVVLVGGDALPMYRFVTPLLPAFFLIFAMGVAGVWERLGGHRPAHLLLSALLAIFVVAAARPAFTGLAYRFVRQDVREVNAWKEIGSWLHANTPADATLAVITAGAIPYFSKLRTIDMLGLNDATIAHRDMDAFAPGAPGHQKFDIDYVLDREPTFILVGVYGLERRGRAPWELVRPFLPAESRMLDSPRFRAAYRLRRARTRGGHFAYFVRIPETNSPPPS